MGLFDGKLKDNFERSKKILKFTDAELASLLSVSESEMTALGEMPSHWVNQENLSETDQASIEAVERILNPLVELNRHGMTPEDILNFYSSPITLTSGKTTVKHALKHLYDYENKKDQQKVRKLLDDTCAKFFRHYEIGDGASPLKALNVRIAKEFLSQKVDIKEKWIYTEGGDHTVLEPQTQSKKDFNTWQALPEWSTDIALAWELVDMLATKGVQIRLSNKAMNNNYWWCYLSSENNPDSVAQGDTAPEAICLAILDWCSKNKV